HLLGQKGLIAIERLMGMVLITVSIQMLMTGIEKFVTPIRAASVSERLRHDRSRSRLGFKAHATRSTWGYHRHSLKTAARREGRPNSARRGKAAGLLDSTTQ